MDTNNYGAFIDFSQAFRGFNFGKSCQQPLCIVGGF